MGREIERKFRVRGDGWRGAVGDGVVYRQGYLATEPERNVRVRLQGDKARLTLKGRADGEGSLTRLEYEYDIPRADAEEILDRLCLRPLIEKTRYEVRHGGRLWEVDEFHGDNRGLVVAEVELEAEDEAVEPPPWVDEEVTDDPRYLNANLVASPFTTW